MHRVTDHKIIELSDGRKIEIGGPIHSEKQTYKYSEEESRGNFHGHNHGNYDGPIVNRTIRTSSNVAGISFGSQDNRSRLE